MARFQIGARDRADADDSSNAIAKTAGFSKTKQGGSKGNEERRPLPRNYHPLIKLGIKIRHKI